MKIVATFEIPDSELESRVPEFNKNSDELGIEKLDGARELADYLVEQIDEGNMDLSDLCDDYNVVVEYEVQEP